MILSDREGFEAWDRDHRLEQELVGRSLPPRLLTATSLSVDI
jgi:hypothetical protein